jgi:hypothetical protein
MTTTDEMQVIVGTNIEAFRKEMSEMSQTVKKFGEQVKESVKPSQEMQEGLNGVAKSASSANPKIATLVAKLYILKKGFELVVGAIKKGINALVNFTKEVMEGGMAYTRLQISTLTIARNMGIAASEVDRLREALARSNTFAMAAEEVIKTLALSGLVQMAEGLSAVDARTGETEKGVTALVLTMKDLAATAGVDSANAIQRFTEFIQSGNRSVVQGLIQMENLGMVYSEFAESIGKTRSELTAQEMAMARMNLVMREGQKAFGAYANTNETAGKAMMSVKNAMDSIKQELGNMLEPVFGAFANALLQMVQGIRNFVMENEKLIRNWASRVAGYVIVVIRILGRLMSMIPMIGSYFQDLANFSLKPIRSMEGTSEAVDQAGASMGGASEKAKQLRKDLAGLAGFDEMNVLRPPEEGGGVGQLGGIGDLGMDMNFGDLGEGFEDLMQKFNEAQEKANEWADKFMAPFRRLKGTLESWWGEIRKMFTLSMSDTGDGVLGQLIDFGLNFWKELVTIKQKYIDPTVEQTLKNWNLIWEGGLKDTLLELQKFANHVMWFALFIYNKLIHPIKMWLINTLAPVWQFAFRVMSTVSVTFWKIVLGEFNKGLRFFNAVLAFIRTGLTEGWGKAFENMGKKVTSVWNGIYNTVRAGINGLIDLINKFINSANKIKVPKELTGGRTIGVNIKPLTPLATGGIVTQPTTALIGEGGNREAVLPLDSNTGWMDELASKIGGGAVNLTVKIGEETLFKKVVDGIRDQNMRSGSNLLTL